MLRVLDHFPQEVKRQRPVGSITSPLRTVFSSPSALVKVRACQFSTCTVISMSLAPSRSSEIVERFTDCKSSILAKELSWNGSIFVKSPMLISGVSLNLRICALSILINEPTSWLNSLHEMNPIVPEGSANRPEQYPVSHFHLS